MVQSKSSPGESLIPLEPIPEEIGAFSKRVQGLMDGQPKDEVTVKKALEGMEEVFDAIAAGLYSLSSMLIGEGEESIRLVEAAIASAEVSACCDPAEARRSSRRSLASAALGRLEQRNPGCLAAPEGMKPAETCIEEDDLKAAGVSTEQLEQMMAGPDRERVRNWLAGLPALMRTVFVLRAVAGFTTAETATMLAVQGGRKAAGWTPNAVSEVFRQGVCSLASQVIQGFRD